MPKKQKEISFKDYYLELIDLDSFGFLDFPNNKEENQEISLKNEFKTHAPFTKDELINYLQSDDFLTLIDSPLKKEIFLKKELKEKINPIELKKLLKDLPLEKKNEELNLEKRRRSQAYKYLDYFLSKYTYFDYFSRDTFEIVKFSKYLAQINQKDHVTPDLLFLSFLNATLISGQLLQKYGFDEKFVQDFFSKSKPDFYKKFLKIFKNIQIFKNLSKFLQKEKFFIDQHIDYSYEVHQIFEKSAQNALSRFKTPLITPEILLITLMEDKNSSIGQMIEEKLIETTNWYIFRYKLLKYLYFQEINLRTNIPRNQHFFAYLLKMEISQNSFEKFQKKKSLSKVVSFFRNILISEVIANNFFENFQQETLFSIFTGPKRKYLT
jgi:hypothetical protein